MIAQLKALVPKPLKRRLQLFLHLTETFTCPFCGQASTLKDLKLIGHDNPVIKEKQIVGGGRRQGKCKTCGSTDRERLIYIYLKEVIGLFETDRKKKILHISPELNLSKMLLKSGFEQYVCGDLFTEGYSYPSYVQDMNVLNIPYEGHTFDLIICNHVLEHIAEDIRAMSELRRVLKPGGQAILQVPISKNLATTFEDFSITDPAQRNIIFGQFDHVRIYGQDYSQRLQKSGFKVDRVNISKRFRQYGLNKNEDIFVCTI